MFSRNPSNQTIARHTRPAAAERHGGRSLQTPARRRREAYRPVIEALEDRCLMSFGTGGIVTTDFSQCDFAQDVALQADGKIVAVGTAQATGNSTSDFAIVRYNSDRSLDTTFGTGGKVTTAIGPGDDRGSWVAIQSDGKIVLAGSASNGSNNDFAVVRYNPDGSLDATFGTGGKVTTAIGAGNDEAHSVSIQSDGKIVVAGSSATATTGVDFAAARYDTNGTLDPTFGTGGTVSTDISGARNDTANGLVIQGDGKIVAAGYVNNPNGCLASTGSDFALVRYNPNGSLDSGSAIAAATAVRRPSPTVAARHTRAVSSIVTIPSHEDARHHAARTEAADQAIASLLGSATRRRFDASRKLDLDAELLADITAGR